MPWTKLQIEREEPAFDESQGQDVRKLSYGEALLEALDQALANDPRFLLMDEPTGNIDSKTAHEIMSLVKRLNEEKGVTIIMVTHDQRLAREAKRTVEMFDGVITSDIANGEVT